MLLALLCLTAFDGDEFGASACKAKSVALSPEGLKRARQLFERHFARKR